MWVELGEGDSAKLVNTDHIIAVIKYDDKGLCLAMDIANSDFTYNFTKKEDRDGSYNGLRNILLERKED